MSNNNVLTTVTKQMISECKTIAERSYMSRVAGYSTIFGAEPNEHGQIPRKLYRGARVEFTALGVDALLDIVFSKIAEGYKRCDTPSSSFGMQHIVYLIKPDAEIKADLEVVFQEAEVELRERVEKANEAIVLDQVAKRKAQVLREREEAAKAADAELEAQLEVEVRQALKVGK